MASREELARAEVDKGSCLRDLDYGNVLGKAILFFEGQRSGKLPAGQRVEWRGDSALSDGRPENVILPESLFMSDMSITRIIRTEDPQFLSVHYHLVRVLSYVAENQNGIQFLIIDPKNRSSKLET